MKNNIKNDSMMSRIQKLLIRAKHGSIYMIYFLFLSAANAQNNDPHLQTNGVERIEGRKGSSIRNVSLLTDEERKKLMRQDGLPDSTIDRLLEYRRRLFAKKETIQPANKTGSSPVPLASCGDMGGENGWNAWLGDIGTANFGGGQTWTPPPGAPAAPNFALMTGAGVDACTPGTAPGSPPLPVVAGGPFGNTSIRLGDPQQAGAVAEKLEFPFTVTPADTNFVYAYAIVIQDAGHSQGDQPFVELCIYDSNGNSIPCGCFRYTGGPLPGFFSGSCAFTPYYKPWTIVGVNLSKYIGQTLRVEITNVDCALGAHYAHSYWDFMCPPMATSMTPFCLGQQTTLIGPNSDPGNPYTYTWYQNGNLYTGPPSATSQSITPTPSVGDTFAVHVHQASGCDFWIPFIPQPMTITPNFIYASSCGSASFTDQTTAPNNVPIVSWNWNFGGGTPNTSAQQNPQNIQYAPGTYTVTLIATSQNGCIDTIQQVVNISGSVNASFTVPPVCENAASVFTGSSPSPIAQWNWNFGDGSTGTGMNASHTYTACGTYTATLIVVGTSTVCADTIVQPVTVNCQPQSAFTAPNVCFNNPTSFTDQSAGNNTISSWAWNFGDGNSSTLQNPGHTYGNAGTYTVSLIITNSGGCKDTSRTILTVHPLPVASFTAAAVCFGDSTCFTNLSTVSTGSVTGFSWNFGDPASGLANTSSLQAPCHLYSAPGNYTIVLTATSDSGCQNTINKPTVIHMPPTAGIQTANACFGATTPFTDLSTASANDPIATWNWNFGDGSAPMTVQNPSHYYTAPGTYTASLIVTTQGGCKDTIQQVVTLYQPPIANFSGSGNGCAPHCVNNFTDLSASADGSIATWSWSFPGGSPASWSGSAPPSICYNNPGSYGASLMITTQFGCSDTVAITPLVNVHPWPTANFCVAPSYAPVNDPKFNFCDLWSSNVTNWVWDFGDNSFDSVQTDPVHSYSASTTANDFYTFQVCLRVETQYGCWDTTCHPVEILPEFTFYIPNTFTPNGDFMNEMFYGKGRGIKEYNIWLFDRWGNQIWDCHHEGKNTDWDQSGQEGLSSYCKWDGKVERGGLDLSGNSRQLAQEDVYVWKVQLTDIFDKKHWFVGHVNIVR